MSDLECVNRALALLNQEAVSGLAEDSKPARVMSVLLAEDKKLVLSAFCWSFAARRSAPTAGFLQEGYRFSYRFPDGALVIRSVNLDGGRMSEWRISGGCIVCDEPAVSIDYVCCEEDLEKWPPLAAEALVQKLAADAAVLLSGEAGLAQALTEKYFALLRQAQSIDVVNERISLSVPDQYIRCR